MADILVVDDDESIATAFQHFLDYEGHQFRVVGSGDDAIPAIAERIPDVVFMDVRMPGRDGLQVLQEVRRRFPDVYVVMMTAYGTSQTSIDAIREGAFDYLTKPLDLDELRSVIAKALAAQRVREKAATAESLSGGVRLVGEAPAMRDVYKMIGRLSATDVPAVVVGERGTGKELVIRTIHDNSARSEQPFISLDCPALSETDLDTTLLGQQGGTVHLAAVDALAPSLQARLARVLNEPRPPSPTGTPTRPRVLVSTEHNLAEDVRSGSFNRELFDALTVVAVRLPPLRERREDIPSLVWHFIQRFNDELSLTIKGIDEEVSRRLQDHSWPGNVGELERVVKRACIVAKGDVITAEDVGEAVSESRFDTKDVESALARSVRTALHEQLVEKSAGAPSSPFHDIVERVESILVEEMLAITKGNQLKAAEILGVNTATLRKKMGSNE